VERLDMRYVRRNDDRRLRELERRLAQGESSPELGWQLFLEYQRSPERQEYEREHAKPEVEVDTQWGRLRIWISDAEHLHLANSSRSPHGEGAWTDPWVINRVPFTFSQHATLEEGHWVVEVSKHGIYRDDRRYRWEPSAAFRRNFKAALESVVNDWASKSGDLLMAGDLMEVRGMIASASDEVDKLSRELHAKQMEIGELFLRELAIRSAQRRQNPWRRWF
jgi:hypothetical protein